LERAALLKFVVCTAGNFLIAFTPECAWTRPGIVNSRCHNGENSPHLRCNFAAGVSFIETAV